MNVILLIKDEIAKLESIAYNSGKTESAGYPEGIAQQIRALKEERDKAGNMSVCYWCDAQAPVIAIPSGKLNSTYGCCQKCHVLSCGHHAQRDKFQKSYLCFDCDIRILLNSAHHISSVAVSSVDVHTPADLPELFGEKDTVYSEEAYLFASYEDFKKRRPGYNGWFPRIEQAENGFIEEDQLQHDALRKVPDDARLLMTAAAVIFAKMYLEEIPDDSFVLFQ